MSQSSKETSENSQPGSSPESLSSGEVRLVQAGVLAGAPSPHPPGQPEPADPPEEAGLEAEPERFQEGSVYTLEQVADARRLALDHLQRQVKDLTDWQFEEQCGIAGLDLNGEPKLTDEQISLSQRAMDRENILA